MAAKDPPVTPAIRFLRAQGIEYEPHLYDYVEKGGTSRSSEELGVDEHAVVKTLVFETEAKKPLVVLMHGDRQVSAKNLARHLGVKAITPCKPETAEKWTGYQVGGTSPFGTRTELPVYVERTILELPRIWINGGKRGFLVSLAPAALAKLPKLEPVEVAIEKA
ncbi:MAG: Cys-tRNA(Pro) deacylase [Planctomycetes bacterium]|nr:Cys-tRNA(Pro) deacylase [Planctomycetota bacterium]